MDANFSVIKQNKTKNKIKIHNCTKQFMIISIKQAIQVSKSASRTKNRSKRTQPVSLKPKHQDTKNNKLKQNVLRYPYLHRENDNTL